MTIVFEEFDNVLMQAAALANELGIDQTDVDKLIRRYRVVNGSHNGYTREVQARLMGVTPRQVDNINAEYRDDVRSRLTTRYEGVTLPALHPEALILSRVKKRPMTEEELVLAVMHEYRFTRATAESFFRHAKGTLIVQERRSRPARYVERAASTHHIIREPRTRQERAARAERALRVLDAYDERGWQLSVQAELSSKARQHLQNLVSDCETPLQAELARREDACKGQAGLRELERDNCAAVDVVCAPCGGDDARAELADLIDLSVDGPFEKEGLRPQVVPHFYNLDERARDGLRASRQALEDAYREMVAAADAAYPLQAGEAAVAVELRVFVAGRAAEGLCATPEAAKTPKKRRGGVARAVANALLVVLTAWLTLLASPALARVTSSGRALAGFCREMATGQSGVRDPGGACDSRGDEVESFEGQSGARARGLERGWPLHRSIGEAGGQSGSPARAALFLAGQSG